MTTQPPIRVQVSLVIEMTAEQAQAYVDEYGLGDGTGRPVRARVVVEDIQSYVLNHVQEATPFGGIGRGDGTRGATVTIKGR
jgi:hypothetical protein